MYPQSEMDTAFNIQVLTSVDFPDWMAKKPRRRSPKTKKTPGKSSKAPIHTRIWADKFQRTQQPRAHVPAPVKVKPEKQVTSAVEIRKPIQYDSWELIIDGEFLLRDYFMRTSPSGSSGSDCCEMGWSEHSDDRGALLEGLRNTSTAAVHQLPAAETNIDYITQLPLQNLTPTPTSHVYAPPDIAPTLFNNIPIHETGIYDPNYEFPKLEQESLWGQNGFTGPVVYGQFQWIPGYVCDCANGGYYPGCLF